MKQSNINFKAKFFTLFIYLTYHARIVSLGSHHWVPRVLYFLYLSKVFLWLKTFFCIFDGVFFLRGSALKPMMILLRLFNVVKILVTSRGSFSLSFHRKLDRVQIFSCLQKYFSNFSKKKFFSKKLRFFCWWFFGPEGMGRDIIRGGGKTSKIVWILNWWPCSTTTITVPFLAAARPFLV